MQNTTKHVAAILAFASLFAGCTQLTSPTPQPPAPQNQSASLTVTPQAQQTSSANYQAAAVKITDVCPLVPMDLAAQIIPGASAPQSQTFPPYRCTISNGTSVLEVTIGAYDTGGAEYLKGGLVNGGKSVSGLAAGAYLENLAGVDDSYLTVLLNADQGQLYVEVAGHDGKNHDDEAIAVATKVLASLL